MIGSLESVNWIFLLGVTAETLRANIGSKPAISLQQGTVGPKFQVEGVAPTNHSSSQKTRLNDFWYGIKIWTDLSFFPFCHNARIWRTDGQTDRILSRPMRNAKWTNNSAAVIAVWFSLRYRFKSSQNRLIIDVNLYDEIDFICPNYPSSSSSSSSPSSSSSSSAMDNQVDAVVDDVSRSLEYYVVYQVSASI